MGYPPVVAILAQQTSAARSADVARSAEQVAAAASQIETWTRSILDWAPSGVAGAVIIVAGWALGMLAGSVARRVGSRARIDPIVLQLISRVIRLAVFVFGVVTGLGTMGVDVSALVAGLGLTGFALGFALRDTLSNTIAGVMLLLYRPFMVDDIISVAGATGKVSAMDLRYTTIASEGKRVLVPNATLLSNVVTVVNANQHP